jgi:hypothetical protein
MFKFLARIFLIKKVFDFFRSRRGTRPARY